MSQLLNYSSKSMHILFFLIIFLISWNLTNLEAEHTSQEAFDALGISWNPDGTLNRNVTIPMVPATPSANFTNPDPPTALSTDITLSNESKACVRLYIPLNPPKKNKLPIILNLHGGDFVLFSVATVIYHKLCEDVASQFPAVVVSVEYRHGPENRLPAAYDDALDALLWIQDQAEMSTGDRDPWMEYADFSRVFILGSGAGGNIAYNVALGALDFDLSPLEIKGVLLNQAFFSGVQKTESEMRLEEDPYVPLYANYVLWSLALPINATRDHEFCNPMTKGTYGGRVFRLPSVYIKGDYGDPLVDRSVQLAEFLISCGVQVTYRFNEGGYHGIELENPEAAQKLYDDMKKFVASISETQLAYSPSSNSTCFNIGPVFHGKKHIEK